MAHLPGQNPPAPPRHPEQTVPVIDVAELLAGQGEARLRLHGQEYRLRITRNEKLILTK